MSFRKKKLETHWYEYPINPIKPSARMSQPYPKKNIYDEAQVLGDAVPFNLKQIHKINAIELLPL
jgi:hypothetical protein